MTRYHLDTSAQVERWFGAAASQARLADVLSTGRQHTTSTHVYREWKRIVDQSAVEILNTVTSENPTDDLPRLAQGYGREPNRRMLVLFSLMREGKGRSWTTEELRLRARQMLAFRSDEMFRKDMSSVRDSSECGLARNKATSSSTGQYSLKVTCKKTEQICRQPNAIEEQVERWTAGAGELQRSEPYASMGKTALKMATNEPERKGINCYGRTGDLSIALECDANETILTTDASFEVIGPAIGREVEKLPATQRPPRN